MDAEAARRWDNISLLALKVEDGARSPGVWALEKARKQIILWSFPEERRPADPGTLAH